MAGRHAGLPSLERGGNRMSRSVEYDLLRRTQRYRSVHRTWQGSIPGTLSGPFSEFTAEALPLRLVLLDRVWQANDGRKSSTTYSESILLILLFQAYEDAREAAREHAREATEMLQDKNRELEWLRAQKAADDVSLECLRRHLDSNVSLLA